MILIIGSDRDLHAKTIYERLESQGVFCCYLDTAAFPETLRLSLTPADLNEAGYIIPPGEKKIQLSEIKSVYWRYHHGIALHEKVPIDVAQIVSREIESALGSMFRNMPHALWVNPVSAIERHRYKTHQLMLMKTKGVTIPDTLVTNDPDAVTEFYKQHNGNLIFKPVAGGAYTARMTKNDLTEKRLKELCKSPVQFQECIEGVDVRVYVIDKNLYAAEIQAETTDFREDDHAKIVPIQLPAEVEAHCHEIADLFDYRFTGIDIRKTPDGRYVFIEGNPSPMFIHFEKQSGYPISQTLMDLLVKGPSKA